MITKIFFFFFYFFSDGSKNGKIAWKIDLESTNLEVKSVELLVNSAIFESGKIIWQLLGGSKAILPTPGKIFLKVRI